VRLSIWAVLGQFFLLLGQLPEPSNADQLAMAIAISLHSQDRQTISFVKRENTKSEFPR
jgi:hypothetical protein